MDIVKEIERYVKERCEEYKNNSTDHYDFWNEHIKYVYKESIDLAKEYNADIEIVSLGSLLHDIALILNVGDKKDHHINGKKLANEILTNHNYPHDKLDKVLSTIYNHRSSKNSKAIEDLCVADADILAHFDNIPMLFNLAYNRCNINLSEVREWMMNEFKNDYDDLSDITKEKFKNRYNIICDVVLGKEDISLTKGNTKK